jgi:hypothetical protein
MVDRGKGGNQSQCSDPYGMYLTVQYAMPAYGLLGRKGLVMMDKKPQVDVAYYRRNVRIPLLSKSILLTQQEGLPVLQIFGNSKTVVCSQNELFRLPLRDFLNT